MLLFTISRMKPRMQKSRLISFIALLSVNGAPAQLHLPFEQCNSNNQEQLTMQEVSQLELVRGARHSTAPQTNAHINGDPLSVFQDSSLSDTSDNGGRYICSLPLSSPPPLTCKVCSDQTQCEFLHAHALIVRGSGEKHVDVDTRHKC